MNELAATAWSKKDDLCEIIIHTPKFLIGSASVKERYQGGVIKEQRSDIYLVIARRVTRDIGSTSLTRHICVYPCLTD